MIGLEIIKISKQNHESFRYEKMASRGREEKKKENVFLGPKTCFWGLTVALVIILQHVLSNNVQEWQIKEIK